LLVVDGIAVDCRFASDGTIDVRRIYMNRKWTEVGQGRQWFDAAGRHVLVMLPDERVQELWLRSDTLIWELRPVGGREIHVV
jgi:hypothetical protein